MTTRPLPHIRRTNVRSHSGYRTTVRAMRALGDAFPDTTARLAIAAWFRPRRYTPPRRETYWQMGAVEFRIGRGTQGVRAWSWGSGPPVLLVHGWEGRGMQLGAFVRPLVDAGFRVVTWDAPAHGRSGGTRSSLFSFADTIGAAIRQLGPVHGVVAHSMGAAATLFALRAGVPVNRVALIAPGEPSKAAARLAETFGLGSQVADAVSIQLRERFGVTLEEISGERLANELQAPLLVIHDENDIHAPLADGERIATAAADGRLIQTAGLGHHRILRDTTVIQQVSSFIAERTLTLSQATGQELTLEDVLQDLHHGRD